MLIKPEIPKLQIFGDPLEVLGVHNAKIARDWNMPNGAEVTKLENLVVVSVSQSEFQTRDHAVPQVD